MRFNLAADLPAVSADATQIRQIIMNLVINAAEAVGERSGVIAMSTGLTRADAAFLQDAQVGGDQPPGDYVFLEVADNGCGMNQETLARIFDPFFTTKFTGRGLGLAAVLGIVRGHHGALKVQSEPGRGTIFRLLLPPADGPVEAAPAPSPVPRAVSGTGTVLVVEDEETVRIVVARMLESLGLRVVLAANGVEALEQYHANGGDLRLVVLDLTMPHMGGEETASELRKLSPDLPVLLMSGYSEHEAMGRFAGKGLAGFIQKPFRSEELCAKVCEILEVKPAT